MSAADIIAALAALDSAELSSVIAGAVLILASRSTGNGGKAPDPPDELLDVAECARRLGKSKSGVYRNGVSLPFRVHGLGAAPRVSRRGLEKYIAERVAK